MRLKVSCQEELEKHYELISSELIRSLHVLEQMADRWNIRGGIPKNEWERDAQSQINIFTGFEAILILDTSLEVRWLVSEGSFQFSSKEFSKTIELKQNTFKTLSNKEDKTFVESFFLHGKSNLWMVSPIYKVDQLDGFLVASSYTSSFLDFALLGKMNPNFSVSVAQDGKPIYGFPYQNNKDWHFLKNLKMLDINWDLLLIPNATFFEKERSLLPLFVAVFGTIVGILLFTTTYFSLEARKRSIELSSANVELETRVNERTAELKLSQAHLIHLEKLSALGKLTGSISHEFNNPLQGIRNAINTISKSPLSEDDVKIASLGIRECDRMAKMICGLRDFYKPTSGEVSPIDINQCIEEVLLLEDKYLEERCIQINVQLSEKIPLVKGVGDQIKQVLLNIVQNAADAISYKGRISLATEKQDSHVIIKIQDTGQGISEDHIKNIFEPFFTTKDTEQGTGLGLSISYGIIKDHGGEIGVKSELGKGSIFTIKLPFNRE